MQGASAGSGVPGQVVEVEKFIPVADEAKMSQMQDALESDKKQIRKQFEKERAKLEAQTAITEEEREKLLKELERE